MPPRPGHRLDLYLVPDEGRPLPDALESVLAGAGWAEGRAAGPAAGEVVRGGYRGVRLDRPPGERLYANGQGGFRVFCPETGDNIVPAFQAAVIAWRDGGARTLACPACGATHDLVHLSFAPAATFGRGAIVLLDVAEAQLTEAGRARAEAWLGPFTVVGSRR